MSPSPHSSSNFGGDPSKSPLPSQQQRSVSAQRQRRRLEMDGNENSRPLETKRSLESPFTTTSLLHRKHHRSSDSLVLKSSKKPDTPIFHTAVVHSSRPRPNPRSAAAKLLQYSINTSSDLRSAMPEADQLPSTSNRFLSERNPNNLQKSSAFPFSRSLNSSFNSSEPQSVKPAGSGVKMSTLHDSVKEKRIQLGILQRMKALTTILEAQMPFLDMWSALEGDYTSSVSHVVEALSNTSLRLPLSGNVRGDVKEAEEMESLVLEVARVAGGERALIEECGEQMSMTFASQVEEMSLQGQLIQMNRSIQMKSSPCS